MDTEKYLVIACDQAYKPQMDTDSHGWADAEFWIDAKGMAAVVAVVAVAAPPAFTGREHRPTVWGAAGHRNSRTPNAE